MRPRFTLWSDYGTSRKYQASTAMRGAGSSIARKCLLTAVILVAAAIGICELFGQAAAKLPGATGGHPQSITGKRSAGVAPIPLSPQPSRLVEEASVTSNITDPAPAHSTTPVLASAPPEDHATLAVNAISGASVAAVSSAPAKASAPPPSAALATAKTAEKPRSVGGRRIVQSGHRPREDDTALFVRDVATRFGHSKEIRAALRMFL
jgi:hypothetical protein